MGRFSRDADGPRVVGFDFGPAAVPSSEPSYEPPAAEFAPPVTETPAPLYPPPLYPPPAMPAAEPTPYAPPVATLAPPVPAEGGWATAPFPPPPAWMPAPPAKNSIGAKVAIGVSVALAVVIVVGLALNAVVSPMLDGKEIPRGVTLHTPERIGGAELMTSPFANQVVAESMKGTVSLQQAQAGLYGTESVPRYFLFAGFSPERSDMEVFDEFRKGFTGEADEASVGKPKAMPGGVVCAPITDGPLKGSACAWASERSNGVLMDYQKADVARLAKLAVQARAEVNGT